MKKAIKLSLVSLASYLISMIFTVNLTAKPIEYTLDKSHSRLGFNVIHMGLSNVYGEFLEFDIDFKWDEKKPSKSKISGSAKVNSIFTKNTKRDSHLKSPDFFDIQTYPTIAFKSTKITKKNNQYFFEGLFTMKNITKKIKTPITIRGPIEVNGKKIIAISGSHTINRFDYNVKWNKFFDKKGLVVGKDVEMVMDLELVESSN